MGDLVISDVRHGCFDCPTLFANTSAAAAAMPIPAQPHHGGSQIGRRVVDVGGHRTHPHEGILSDVLGGVVRTNEQMGKAHNTSEVVSIQLLDIKFGRLLHVHRTLAHIQ